MVNPGGFTLVEVLVAIVAAALVTASAHRGLALLADLEERSAAERQRVLRAAAVRRQLASWLRSAYLSDEPHSPGFVGRDGSAEDGEPRDLLVFPTLAPGPFDHGMARVRVWIDSDPVTPHKGLIAHVTLGRTAGAPMAGILPVPPAKGRTAAVRNAPPVKHRLRRVAGMPSTKGAVPHVTRMPPTSVVQGALSPVESDSRRRRRGPTRELGLVPKATGLDVRYLFDRGSGPEWFTGWISTVQLPEAIDLRILGDSVPPLLRIPLLIPLGGGG